MRPEVILFTHMLSDTRAELMEEMLVETEKRSTCYIANLQIGRVLTKALIDTEAEVTCISEDFVNSNKEWFKKCLSLLIIGVALAGPMGGKPVRLNKQLYIVLQLPDHVLQLIFVVVLGLSRSCIIGINVLDELRPNIDLDNKTLTFPYLEGQPSIGIFKNKGSVSSQEDTYNISVSEETHESADEKYDQELPK